MKEMIINVVFKNYSDDTYVRSIRIIRKSWEDRNETLPSRVVKEFMVGERPQEVCSGIKQIFLNKGVDPPSLAEMVDQMWTAIRTATTYIPKWNGSDQGKCITIW